MRIGLAKAGFLLDDRRIFGDIKRDEIVIAPSPVTVLPC
jgi:hypothetical protein